MTKEWIIGSLVSLAICARRMISDFANRGEWTGLFGGIESSGLRNYLIDQHCLIGFNSDCCSCESVGFEEQAGATENLEHKRFPHACGRPSFSTQNKLSSSSLRFKLELIKWPSFPLLSGLLLLWLQKATLCVTLFNSNCKYSINSATTCQLNINDMAWSVLEFTERHQHQQGASFLQSQSSSAGLLASVLPLASGAWSAAHLHSCLLSALQTGAKTTAVFATLVVRVVAHELSELVHSHMKFAPICEG